MHPILTSFSRSAPLALVALASVATSPNAQTSVCGLIPDGTVWTLTHSPVIVTCDLRIAGLRIDPGVEVLLAGNYRIEVNGRLRSLGTRSAPVVFRPAPGNTSGWKGIFFQDTIPGSEFRWTQIEGSTDGGVRLVRSYPTFDYVTFKANSASYGGGLRAELLDTDLSLNNCFFEGNYANVAGGAIYVTGPSGPGDPALYVTASVFLRNAAGTTSTTHNTRGGALFIQGNSSVLQSTFIGNEARAYTIYAYGGRYTRGGAPTPD